MKKLTKYVVPCVAALLASGNAQGQNLEKEVVIERDIVPVERPATRPSWVAPGVYTPVVEARRLKAGEYKGAAELTRRAGRIEPVSWNDTIAVSPYRGYAAAGYFPMFNLGASAGYRFARTQNTDAGAWIQYDGASWKGYDEKGEKTSLNTLTFGADLTQRIGNGRLSADLGYTFSRAAYQPASEISDDGLQTLNSVDLSIDWNSSALKGRLDYGIGARIGYSAFGKKRIVKGIPYDPVTSSLVQPGDIVLDPMKETRFGVGAMAAYHVGASSVWKVSVDADFMKSSHGVGLLPWRTPVAPGTDDGYDPVTAVIKGDGANLGDIAVTPTYSFVRGNFSATLGLRIDLNTGGGKGVDVAPAVNMSWAASPLFGVSLDVTGGETLNTISRLYSRMPWMAGVLNHGRTHVPVDARLSLNLGQYNGFSAVVFGGFSKADNVSTPVRLSGLYTWINHSMTGFNYGITVGYEYRDLLKLTASGQGARHGKYYRWLDNAKWVLDFNLEVKPMRQLALELGWDVRIDRRIWDLKPAVAYYTTDEGKVPISYWRGALAQYGDANNLHFGAKWAFNDAFTVFARGENLLNHYWSIMPGLKSKGITGAVGLEVKF